MEHSSENSKVKKSSKTRKSHEVSEEAPVEEPPKVKKQKTENGKEHVSNGKSHKSEDHSEVKEKPKKEKKSLIGTIEQELEDKAHKVDKKLLEQNNLDNFKIHSETKKILQKLGISYLFPIQAATYEPILSGKDLIGRDRTGSGKTYSYALPLTEAYREAKLFTGKNQFPLCLILLPTRELAIQVTNTFKTLLHTPHEFKVLSVYGGTDIRAQIQEIRGGCDIMVGTPGRVIDMIDRNVIKFTNIKLIVLDEADQMLDMGFQEDIEKIYESIFKTKKKEELQNLLFSATIPDWVHNATKKFLKPEHVKIDLIEGKEIKTPKTVRHMKINCPFYSRMGAIADLITCYGGSHSRTIIFCETKHEANDIMLQAKLKQDCQVLHGDIPQKQREVTFKAFKEGKVQVLIATNVAARGLDIPEIDLVLQLDPPKDIDTYIHRAGRTARAGRNGMCVTFYTKKQVSLIERIERMAKIKFETIGAPQPQDIIKANSRDIIISMKNVPKEVLNLFTEIADELIEDLGPRDPLLRALALISGVTEKVKQRSLLTSIEGYVTYLAENPYEFRNLGYVWGFLKRHFPLDLTEAIKGMKMYKNSMGAAFDVLEKDAAVIDAFIAEKKDTRGFVLKKAETLPEFNEDYGGFSVVSRDSSHHRVGGTGNYGGGNYGGRSFSNGNGNGNRNRSYNDRRQNFDR